MNRQFISANCSRGAANLCLRLRSVEWREESQKCSNTGKHLRDACRCWFLARHSYIVLRRAGADRTCGRPGSVLLGQCRLHMESTMSDLAPVPGLRPVWLDDKTKSIMDRAIAREQSLSRLL